MHHPTSSTFSSEEERQPGGPSPLAVGAWSVVFVVLADLLLGMVCRYPTDPVVEPPGSIARMLEIGRSTSGKFRAMVGAHTEPWYLKGNWIGSAELDVRDGPGPVRAAFFGNSFMARLVGQAKDLASDARITSCIGTFSPPSQALGCFQKLRGEINEDVVVLGVLASTWPMARSFSNSTYAFTNPEAYTYPVYTIGGDGLRAHYPLVATKQDLARRFVEPEFDRAWREQLAEYDGAYESFLYDESPLDSSVVGRLFRRAYAVRVRRGTEAQYAGPQSFDPLWRSLLEEFADEVRADGRRPFVVLFQDFGYGADLNEALGPTLDRKGVVYVSSHELFSADDPKSFGEDRHYRPDLDRRLGQEVLKRIALPVASVPTH